MTSFSDFIVYSDESGDHGMDNIDPNFPLLVLSFCIFKKADYSSCVVPGVISLKFKHFGHDQVILHERDIRKKIGDFVGLQDRRKMGAFCEDVNALVESIPLTAISCVIRKDWHKGRYSSPTNPYDLAMGFALERIFMHLNYCTTLREGKTHIIFERRGDVEDLALKAEFQRVCCGGNHRGHQLPFEIMIADKRANSAGLQIADLISRPIGLNVLRPEQPNRAYAIIERKLRSNPMTGQIKGYGLKVFP